MGRRLHPLGLLALYFFLVGVVGLEDSDAEIPLHSSPVQVKRKDSGRVTVRTPLGFECTFAWDASGAGLSSDAADEAGGAGVDKGASRAAVQSAAVQALHGTTFASGRVGAAFWYEVTLGPAGGAWQLAGDSSGFKYSLGTPAAAPPVGQKRGKQQQPPPRQDPSVHHFAGGDPCGVQPRSAVARLYCGPEPAIARSEEPSTCSYQLSLTHPSLCSGDFPFPPLPEPKPQSPWFGGGGGWGSGAAPSLPVTKGVEGLLKSVPAALRESLRALEAGQQQQTAAAAAVGKGGEGGPPAAAPPPPSLQTHAC